jgi:hypothetical protein
MFDAGRRVIELKQAVRNSSFRRLAHRLIFPVIFAIICRDLTTLTPDDLRAKVDRFQSFTPRSSMLKTAAGCSRLIFTSDKICLNIVLPPL